MYLIVDENRRLAQLGIGKLSNLSAEKLLCCPEFELNRAQQFGIFRIKATSRFFVFSSGLEVSAALSKRVPDLRVRIRSQSGIRLFLKLAKMGMRLGIVVRDRYKTLGLLFWVAFFALCFLLANKVPSMFAAHSRDSFKSESTHVPAARFVQVVGRGKLAQRIQKLRDSFVDGDFVTFGSYKKVIFIPLGTEAQANLNIRYLLLTDLEQGALAGFFDEEARRVSPELSCGGWNIFVFSSKDAVFLFPELLSLSERSVPRYAIFPEEGALNKVKDGEMTCDELVLLSQQDILEDFKKRSKAAP